MKPFEQINRRFPLERKEAFTLVEVTIVGVILAVILALLLPALSQQRKQANSIKCAGGIREVGAALNAYRADHNGYYPPGRPRHPEIDKDSVSFRTTLVPDYLGRLPVCPDVSKEMSEAEKKIYGTVEELFRRAYSGTCSINGILTQYKPEQLPGESYFKANYSPDRLPFVIETGVGSVVSSHSNMNQALNGVAGHKTGGRGHGSGDSIWVMFLDGHMALVARNDKREVPTPEHKDWGYPANPTANFSSIGANGLYILPTQLNIKKFEEVFGAP